MNNSIDFFNINIIKKFKISNKTFLNKMYINIKNSKKNNIKYTITKKSEVLLTKKELLDINDSTSFFPDNISKFIINKPCDYLIYNFTINDRKFQIHIYCYKNDFSVNNIDFIINWFVLLDKIAIKKCSNNVNVYLFLTDFNKELPNEKNKMLTPKNVNSAFTYGCKNNNKIVIFRNEEWKKVLLHETFHTFNLDFHINNFSELKKMLRGLYQINSDFLVFETYCEFFASIWYCAIEAYEISKGKKEKFINYIEIILAYEQQYFTYQTAKILNHFNCNYVTLKNNQCSNYSENTNVFCYYVLKAICFIHFNEFIKLCDKYFINNNILNINFTKKCEKDFILFFEKYAFHDKSLNMMNYMHIIAKKNNDKSLKMMLTS
tara:strand:- start:1618 stop:2748 length:1131 start_codon:yes stop_codon:yes gene_type:complete